MSLPLSSSPSLSILSSLYSPPSSSFITLPVLPPLVLLYLHHCWPSFPPFSILLPLTVNHPIFFPIPLLSFPFTHPAHPFPTTLPFSFNHSKLAFLPIHFFHHHLYCSPSFLILPFSIPILCLLPPSFPPSLPLQFHSVFPSLLSAILLSQFPLSPFLPPPLPILLSPPLLPFIPARLPLILPGQLRRLGETSPASATPAS